MSSISWKIPASGTWSLATNWASTAVPGAADAAVIAGNGSAAGYAVTIDAPAALAGLTLADSSATLAVGGVLSVAGTIALGAGTLALTSSLSGGTLAQTGGHFTSFGGTLSHVTVQGTLSLAADRLQSLHIAGGITFASNAVLNDGIALLLDDAKTNFDNVTVNFTGGLGIGITGTGTQALVLGPQFISNDVAGGTISVVAGVTNAGTILAAKSGSNFAINTKVFTNSGTVAVSNGDKFYIGGHDDLLTSGKIVNTGSISATGSATLLVLDANATSQFGRVAVSNGATLELIGGSTYRNSGTNRFSIPGSLTYAGGVLALGGTLTNSGTIVTSAAVTGVIDQAGATGVAITGGTVVDAAGLLRVASLRDVTYRGTLNAALDFSSAISLLGTTTLTDTTGTGAGALVISGVLATVLLDGSAAFPYGGRISFAGAYETLSLTGTTLDNVQIAIGTGAQSVEINGGTLAHDLTLGSRTLIADYGGNHTFAIGTVAIKGKGGGSLTNNGTIIAASAANTMTLLAEGSFTNTGTIAISNGETLKIMPHGAFTNTGVISVTGTGSVLALDPGSFAPGNAISITNGAELDIFVGNKAGAYQNSGINTLSVAGAISNAGGTVALGGTITNTGTLITSAALIGASASVVGGTVIDASGRFAVGGDLTNVTYRGAINLTSLNDTLSLHGTDTFAGAVGGTPGVINITGVFSALSVAGGSVINLGTAAPGGAGTINLTGTNAVLNVKAATVASTTVLDNAVINFGSSAGGAASLAISARSNLTLGKHLNLAEQAAGANGAILFFAGTGCNFVNNGTISLSGNASTLTARAFFQTNTSYGLLSNAGTIAISNAATFAVTTANFSSAGLVNISGSQSALDLRAAIGFKNLAASTLTGGTYALSAGGVLQLQTGTHIATLAADITLNGAGTAVQAQTSASSTSQVTLETTLASISAKGALRVLGGRGYTATTAIANSGIVQLGGGVFATGAVSVAATGVVLGYGRVTGAIADGGRIEAQGGTLVIAQSIGGAGMLQIDSGATLVLAGSAASGLSVAFTGTGDTLKLDQAAGFAAKISGFAATDRLDLSGITATSASVTGTLLTISESNGSSLTLTLAAPLSGVSLAVSGDGAGGSFITANTAAMRFVAGTTALATVLAQPSLGDLAATLPVIGHVHDVAVHPTGVITAGLLHAPGYDPVGLYSVHQHDSFYPVLHTLHAG